MTISEQPHRQRKYGAAVTVTVICSVTQHHPLQRSARTRICAARHICAALRAILPHLAAAHAHAATSWRASRCAKYFAPRHARTLRVCGSACHAREIERARRARTSNAAPRCKTAFAHTTRVTRTRTHAHAPLPLPVTRANTRSTRRRRFFARLHAARASHVYTRPHTDLRIRSAGSFAARCGPARLPRCVYPRARTLPLSLLLLRARTLTRFVSCALFAARAPFDQALPLRYYDDLLLRSIVTVQRLSNDAYALLRALYLCHIGINRRTSLRASPRSCEIGTLRAACQHAHAHAHQRRNQRRVSGRGGNRQWR